MIPGNYNMHIYRGGTFSVDLTATDSDGDITFSDTYTSAWMGIYHAWLDDDDQVPATPLMELTTQNGLIILNQKVITLELPASVTATLSFVSGVYLIKLIVGGPNPIVDPFLKGRVLIEGVA